MTEPSHPTDECEDAVAQVQAFLHNELPASAADLIRAHLNACDKCLEDFDVEAEITRLVRRASSGTCAPARLRMSINSLTVRVHRSE